MITAVAMPKGIRKRKGRYMYDVSHGGQRVTGTCDRLEDALTKRAEALAELKATGSKRRSTQITTLEGAFNNAYSSVWQGTKGEKTAIINSKSALDFFGCRCKLTDIDTLYVNEYVEHLRSIGNKSGTINRKLAALSVILKTAEEAGAETGKPIIKRRKEYSSRDRFITPEEERVMVETLEQWGKQDHLEAVIVLIDTGIRTGELFRLTFSDVDMRQGESGILSVWTTKNNRPRSVPMTRRVKAIIQRRRTMLQTGEIFPYNKQWLRNTWDRLKAHMGLAEDTQFVPHILRHTCASRLVQAGVPLPVVQQFMGHTSIQTTMRYSHLCPTNLYNAVNALEPQ